MSDRLPGSQLPIDRRNTSGIISVPSDPVVSTVPAVRLMFPSEEVMTLAAAVKVTLAAALRVIALAVIGVVRAMSPAVVAILMRPVVGVPALMAPSLSAEVALR